MAGSNKRHLSKSSVAYIALGVIMISLMTILGTSVFLRATYIRVEGTVVYTAEEVVESSGLAIGDGLIRLNSQRISQNIREALPFVSAARITRKLPNTVLIEITESSAVATVSFGGELLAVDSGGRVIARSTGRQFSLQGVNADDLIEVRGVDISEGVVGSTLRSDFLAESRLQNMQDILSAFEREGIVDDVSYLDVSNNRNIHFGYKNIYRVVLGERSFLRTKLELLPSMAERFAQSHPNSPGDINMTEVSDVSNEVKFRPTQ